MAAPTDRPPAVDARTWIGVVIVAAAALTVLGLVALWPRGDAPEIDPLPQIYVDGTIAESTSRDTCSDIEYFTPVDCVTYDVQLSSGPDRGTTVQFSVRPTQTEIPDLAEGDDIVLRHFPESPPEFRYAFSDFQRSTPMLWLLAAFVIVVLAFGRLQGLRALVGLGLSPALLRDSSPLMVALVGSAAVAFLAIYIAHGIGITSTIALAGTLASLAVTSLLAVVVATTTQLSGLASQEAQTLRMTAEALDLRGLL